jgi:hypothetical protein
MIFFALFGIVLYFAVIWLAMEGARERYRNPVWGDSSPYFSACSRSSPLCC